MYATLRANHEKLEEDHYNQGLDLQATKAALHKSEKLKDTLGNTDTNMSINSNNYSNSNSNNNTTYKKNFLLRATLYLMSSYFINMQKV